MTSMGYSEVGDNFLVKQFDNIEINVSKNGDVLQSITGYEDDKITAIPAELLEIVKSEINECL